MSELRLDRVLAADRSTVWHAITDASSLAQWFWPPRYGTKADIELRPGGHFRVTAESGPFENFGVTGEYSEIEALSKAAFSWQWNGAPKATSVNLLLTEQEDGTRLVVVHSGFADHGERDQHIQGWDDCLDRLEAWLG